MYIRDITPSGLPDPLETPFLVDLTALRTATRSGNNTDQHREKEPPVPAERIAPRALSPDRIKGYLSFFSFDAIHLV